MMTLIPVPLSQRSYQIAIAPGGLPQLGSLLADPTIQSQKLGRNMLVVSNPEIWEHYGQTVADSLQQAGFTVSHCLLPAGEQHKHVASIQTLYDAALANRLERSSTMVALGGGVIGDMTGFAAATWLRGINVVQVPTSLLAMVDASIGGKTGVNHPQGKNLIGAFHQPRLVLIDPDTLRTLPVREFRAAMAEVIKYGVIWDADLFDQLEAAERLDEQTQVPPALLAEILRCSCQAKADVVSQDEREGGVRAILNYGHTIGHAIESLTGYSQFNHGEAVGLGMLAAGHIAIAMGWWTAAENQRQQRLVAKVGLPCSLPKDFPVQKVAQVLLSDKKVKDGKVRFILPKQIGAVEITDQVSETDILQSLHHLIETYSESGIA